MGRGGGLGLDELDVGGGDDDIDEVSDVGLFWRGFAYSGGSREKCSCIISKSARRLQP